MNILIVSHGIPSAQDPQWGGFELDQARALSELGHNVVLAAVDGRFRRFRRQRGITRTDFGPVRGYLMYRFPLKLVIDAVLRRDIRARMMASLFAYIVRNEGMPDIIYAHYLFSMEALDRVRKRYPDIPVVGIEHWSKLSAGNLTDSMLARGKRVYNGLPRLLVVSGRLQEEIRMSFGKDSTVVCDMVGDAFLSHPIRLDKTRTPFRFISVGSLVEGKCFDVLIRAFSGLEDRTAELVIVGDGPQRESLRNLCKSLGVSDRVVFTGMLQRSEIIDWLDKADAFVLASRSETFGVCCIEALAMGLPVVSTRCGGPESFMNEKCGLMVDVDDVDGLTEAMRQMNECISSYDAEEMRGYIRSRFSGEVIAGQLVQIFEEEIKKKNR